MGTTFPKNHPWRWVWGSRLGPHTPSQPNPSNPPGAEYKITLNKYTSGYHKPSTLVWFIHVALLSSIYGCVVIDKARCNWHLTWIFIGVWSAACQVFFKVKAWYRLPYHSMDLPLTVGPKLLFGSGFPHQMLLANSIHFSEQVQQETLILYFKSNIKNNNILQHLLLVSR